MFSWYEHADEMVDKLRMRGTDTQLIDPLVHMAPNDHECNVSAIAIGPVCPWSDGFHCKHRPLLPKLDILAVDGDEEPPEEWEAEDDVKGEPLDPHEVKNAHEKEIKYLWDMEVRIFHRSAGTGANRTQPSWPQVDRYQQRKRRSPTLPFAYGVYGGAP